VISGIRHRQDVYESTDITKKGMRIRKRRYGPGFERIVKSVLHLFAFLILVFIAIWHKELLAFVTPFFRWLL